MRGDSGYAMAVLLIGVAVMTVMMTVAMPVWHQTMQREKEEELIFRGTQYARAVGLWQRKFAGSFPPSVDVLVQQKFLRKKYKDPMVDDGEFQLIPAGAMQAGQAGVTLNNTNTQRTAAVQFKMLSSSSSSGQTLAGGLAGVVSKSKDKSIKLYNGREHYNEWMFVYSAPTGRGGRGGRGIGPGQGGGTGTGTGGGRGRGQGPGSIFDQTGQGRGGRGRGGFGPGQE